ncbi:MAG: hypothetical protein PVH88_14435 [Ignavibacteria bacterium]|jgi:hypothetical protein
MAKKKEITEKVPTIKIQKLSGLKKADFDKVNLDELWVMKPSKEVARLRARYCGCRNVCLV